MNQTYTITIAGRLPKRWSEWLESTEATYQEEKKQTSITVEVADQTALHGVLERIRDLNLRLISLYLSPSCPEA